MVRRYIVCTIFAPEKFYLDLCETPNAHMEADQSCVYMYVLHTCLDKQKWHRKIVKFSSICFGCSKDETVLLSIHNLSFG